MFIKEMQQRTDRVYKFGGLPRNTQKFRTLEVNSILFMDSFAFLSDSLAKLTKTLVLSDHDFPILSQFVEKEEDRRMLMRKGVYPYSYATSLERLESTAGLPDIEHFVNDLGGDEPCDPDDYRYAQDVFKTFGCSNMVDYTMLYLKTDVHLLAEAVLNLRQLVFERFKLDICNYFSLPMLSKDLMLKTSGVKIELISDPEMSGLLQHNIRGGVSFINTRVAYKRSGFSLCYLDANNLYGKAMSFPLPLRGFRWMTQEELDRAKTEWRTMITDEVGPGYIFEVTLRYPKSLHLKHNSFPLAPEQVRVTEDMLSPYTTDCLKTLTGKTKHDRVKLTATFNDREKYLVHGLNLKLYLEQGLELVDIHRGIAFHQEPFIKGYIDMCTEMRAKALTKSEKDMWKLLCNSLYGKVG